MKNQNKTSSLQKTRSVAAFMFLPQFRMMLPAFAHIMPIFVRTLAVMFIQSGLIRANHPAAMYGSVGAEKFSFRSLMGEAWFTLRTSEGQASPYQWGMFLSIVMMLGTIALSIAVFAFALTSKGMSLAQAQIFNHPSGQDTGLIAGGVGATDAVPAHSVCDPSTGTNSAPGTPLVFDRGCPTQAGGDLAIDILNKVLRQPALGQGGLLQNAFAALINVYNTGVLVIASFVVFWAIMSIIIDTARTGQVGGGRHNMVWAPIRFVFAMGLMIPIGAGFSSGQIMVMKLAEWGSNFGSQGWYRYVSAAMNENLLAPFRPQDPTEAISAFTRIKTCQAIVNTYLQTNPGNMTDPSTWPTTGSYIPYEIPPEDFGEYIVLKEDWLVGAGPGGIIDPATPVAFNPATHVVDQTPGTYASKVVMYYGNDESDTFCGGAQFPSENDPGLDLTHPIDEAQYEARFNMLDVLYTLETPYAGVDFTDVGCAFVHRLMPDEMKTQDGTPGSLTGGGGTYGYFCDLTSLQQCNFTPYGTTPVNMPTTCIQTLVQEAADILATTWTTVEPDLATYLDPGNASGLMANVRDQGWAGMGAWYHSISRMNAEVAVIADVNVSFIAPDFGGKSWFFGSTDVSEKAREALDFYDQWWSNVDAPPLPANILSEMKPSGQRTDTDVATKKAIESLKEEDVSGTKKWETISEVVFPGKGFFLVDLTSYEDTYPLAALSDLGNTIFLWVLGIFAVFFVASSFAGIEVTVGAGFLGLVKAEATLDLGDILLTILASPVGQFISNVASLLLLASLALMYLVPILPWIRVTFGVMSWIVSVFEAVIMVPVVALAHLRSDGEGLVPDNLYGAYVLFLNILLRPILMVIGYIGALLIFNSMVLYIHNTLAYAVVGINGGGDASALQRVVYTIVYVGMIYTMANSVFKLIDIIPNATMKWIGGPQSNSFDDSAVEAMMMAGMRATQGVNPSASAQKALDRKDNKYAKYDPKGGGGGFMSRAYGRSVYNKEKNQGAASNARSNDKNL